jgi:hypothetical protein
MDASTRRRFGLEEQKDEERKRVSYHLEYSWRLSKVRERGKQRGDRKGERKRKDKEREKKQNGGRGE